MKKTMTGIVVSVIKKNNSHYEDHNLIFIGCCLLYFCLHLCAGLQSFNQKNNASIIEILKEIEKNSEFTFFLMTIM